MSTRDSKDVGTTRTMNRAVMVAAAMKYLGREREHHCELLGDIMTGAIETISAVANVNMRLESEIPADAQRVLDQLGPQIQLHAERIANAAIQVLTDVYLKTLIVASGTPIDD
jgi:hypothetical protein